MEGAVVMGSLVRTRGAYRTGPYFCTWGSARTGNKTKCDVEIDGTSGFTGATDGTSSHRVGPV